MNWSLIISIGALCLSGITYILHDRRIKKQESLINMYQLEKIHTEKVDKKKAAIKANVIKEDQGRRLIKVFNAGKSVARDIYYEILSENQDFMILNEDIFPFALLNPQENTELIMMTTTGSPDKIKMRFIWEDDSNLTNTYEQILTL